MYSSPAFHDRDIYLTRGEFKLNGFLARTGCLRYVLGTEALRRWSQDFGWLVVGGQQS